MTCEEKCEAMVKGMEKMFNTGPIIGESRRLLMHMSQNLYYRDLYLDVVGVDENRRVALFEQIAQISKDRDAEILKARAEGKVTP
jgi:hypothetical protein